MDWPGTQHARAALAGGCASSCCWAVFLLSRSCCSPLSSISSLPFFSTLSPNSPPRNYFCDRFPPDRLTIYLDLNHLHHLIFAPWRQGASRSLSPRAHLECTHSIHRLLQSHQREILAILNRHHLFETCKHLLGCLSPTKSLLSKAPAFGHPNTTGCNRVLVNTERLTSSRVLATVHSVLEPFEDLLRTLLVPSSATSQRLPASEYPTTPSSQDPFDTNTAPRLVMPSQPPR